MNASFLLAAPTSGSGKTTLARGLMALLTAKGYRVQPFKCGPDYIDTKMHEAVSQRPSINLDTFMASPEHVQRLFRHYGHDADVCVAEGMMGLFDGYDRDRGSTAEIARVLGLPVVLVVNAKSAAYSISALLAGFMHFRPDVHISGVIFNQVGSERHYRMLQQVCSDAGIDCYGYLPADKALQQGSRYLGLDFSNPLQDTYRLANRLEQSVDWQRLLQLKPTHSPFLIPHSSFLISHFSFLIPHSPWEKRGSALIARNDESFSFIYQEVIDSFSRVRFFDPETQVPDFEGVDLLYLPGGYPELHAEVLTANEACRRAISDFVEQGGQVQAECGGMMYLCQSIVTDQGEYAMCGVLPHRITARTADRRLSLGYRRFTLDGCEYRGHEFHYTQFLPPSDAGDGTLESSLPSAAQVYNAKGEPVDTPVLRYKGVLASYTHLSPSLQAAPKDGTPQQHAPSGDTPSATTHRGRLHPVMLAGTGSDVGKSVLATAFCRIFRQDGYHPAPFKAQNMALNSYATPDGLEIGRAQAVQAEAAGIDCHTDMNPLLLKPQSDHTSQVVLHGRPIGSRDAYDYWRRPLPPSPTGGDELPSSKGAEGPDFRREVCEAYDRLATRYNPIVMEGAGSISELNLRQTDLVNLPMARHAGADVLLVADIDRGGVFASVYGSIALQTPEDRRRIKGIIVNKFRGDLRLFDDGRRLLEQVCGIPVLGVVPYAKDIHIEEEDSVALTHKSLASQQGKVNIAVVMLRHLSNYTDFDALELNTRVHLYYTSNTDDLMHADIIILPGTKSTLDDLYELRRNGVAQAIVRAHREGATVMGICGGFQMMGVEVCDPDHVEGDIERLPGLGLLPVSTTMSGEKVTRQVHCRLHPDHSTSESGHGTSCTDRSTDVEGLMQGYEIHMGETRPFGDAAPQPLLLTTDGHADGYMVSQRCMGTYVHGILDHAAFQEFLLAPFADRLQQAGRFDYQAYKEEQYDRLADHVRRHVDMEKIYQILQADD